jgi:hypothetical protein
MRSIGTRKGRDEGTVRPDYPSCREEEGLAVTPKELEAFIQRLDKEIAQEHEEFARNSPNFWSRGDPLGGRPLIEREKSTRDRFEKELDRLAGQRDEARRKLIELTPK